MNSLRRSMTLGLLAGLPGIPLLSKIFFPAALAADSRGAFERGLTALIDTFVPADETPGAVELGIQQPIIDNIRANQGYVKVILQTLDSMDMLMLDWYSQRFEQGTLKQRTEVVLRILGSREQYKDARIQISSLRTRTLSAFYATDSAFTMLDYHPPSQGGYPDYDRPPI